MLFVLVLLPLWASYLARVYAWRLILEQRRAAQLVRSRKLGLPPANIAYTNTAVWIVFTYIWLPFMILPIYASLERIPHSYIEASRDLGATGFRTLRTVILPLALPGVVAGSIFTFALTLGDYITPMLVGGPSSQFIGNVVYDTVNQSSNLPVRRRVRGRAARRDGRLPRDRPPARRVRGALMETARHTHRARRLGGARARVPLHPDRAHLPLRVQLVERAELADRRADDEVVLAGAPQPRHAAGALAVAEGGRARDDDRARARVAAAFGVHRFRFFGRETISFLLVLPIALPGIITGMALNSYFTFWKFNFGLWTIVIGHATFCVVVVYNNVIARLRRRPAR